MQSPTSSINKLRNSLTSFYVKSSCTNKTSPIKEDPTILQNLLRMQQKEIDRLEHQNKNLQVLTQHQCSMLYQERTVRTNSTKLQIHQDLPQSLPNTRNARRSTIKNVLQAMKPPPRKIVVSNKLQMTNNECFKLSSILEATNSQAKQLYHDDSSIQLVKEILKDEDSFIDIITTYPPQQVSIMYDKIKKLINEHEQMFEMILKFKQIIDNSFNLQNIKLQLEALNLLSQQCKNILECKNAQIITNNDETSKSYIQHVYNNKQILNLKNAKFDERFKNENFNQLLAAPILDNNRCLGVIVCQDKSINFNNEDEILIQYICRQAQYILNNQVSNNKIEIQLQKYQHALKSLLLLQSIDDLETKLNFSQQRLCEIMNSSESKIILLQQNNEIKKSIVWEAINNNQTLFINNCYNHENFQPNIDINTQLPIIATPIKYQNKIIGGIEFILYNKQISSIDQEILDLFIQILGINFYHFTNNQF